MNSLSSVSNRLRHLERPERVNAGTDDRLGALLSAASTEEFAQLGSAIELDDQPAQDRILEEIERRLASEGPTLTATPLAQAFEMEQLRRAGEGVADIAELHRQWDALSMRELSQLAEAVRHCPRIGPEGKFIRLTGAAAELQERGRRRILLGLARTDRHACPGRRGYEACWWGDWETEDCECLATAVAHPRALELGKAGVRKLAAYRHRAEPGVGRASGAERRRRARDRRALEETPEPVVAVVEEAPEDDFGLEFRHEQVDEVPAAIEPTVEPELAPVAQIEVARRRGLPRISAEGSFRWVSGSEFGA